MAEAPSLETRLSMADIRNANDYLAAIRKYIEETESQGHRLEAMGARALLQREERNLKPLSGTAATGYVEASIKYNESRYTYRCKNKWHQTVWVTQGRNERFVKIATRDPAMYTNSAQLEIECSIDVLRQIVAIADEMAAKRKGKNGSL